MKLNLKTTKLFFQNLMWAAIFTAFGGTCATLYFMGLPCKSLAIVENNAVYKSNLLKLIPYHYETEKGRIDLHITVSNAGVKGQMGTVCKSGYKLKDPECCGALCGKLLPFIPYFSYVQIEIPNAPQLNGWYKVVDESTMQSGFEIYINNPSQLVIGGSWLGAITAIKWKINNH
jgi:hypothetical protein